MPQHRDSRLTKFGLAIFFILVLFYGLYEAQGLLFGPVINVTSQVSVVNEPFITVRGHADHIAALSMNGKTISVTEDGVFDEPFVLAPGDNHIVFDAVDKYGRSSQRILEVVYAPDLTTTEATGTSSASSTKAAP